MPKRVRFILFLLLASITIIFINHGVANYDLRFYSGKDNGYFLRFASICILSSLYFVLMTDYNKILGGFIGLVFGFIFGIISYFLVMFLIPDPFEGTVYYIFTCIMFMTAHFVIENYKNGKKNYS